MKHYRKQHMSPLTRTRAWQPLTWLVQQLNEAHKAWADDNKARTLANAKTGGRCWQTSFGDSFSFNMASMPESSWTENTQLPDPSWAVPFIRSSCTVKWWFSSWLMSGRSLVTNPRSVLAVDSRLTSSWKPEKLSLMLKSLVPMPTSKNVPITIIPSLQCYLRKTLNLKSMQNDQALTCYCSLFDVLSIHFINWSAHIAQGWIYTLIIQIGGMTHGLIIVFGNYGVIKHISPELLNCLQPSHNTKLMLQAAHRSRQKIACLSQQVIKTSHA